MRYELKTNMERLTTLRTAEALRDMLTELNRSDVLPLCADFPGQTASGEVFPHPESVYGNMQAALKATLRLLGVDPDDEDMWDVVMGGEPIEPLINKD